MNAKEISWVIAPTQRFAESVEFFRDVIGLTVISDGICVTDTQFTRYAQMKLPDGTVLEVVQPREALAHLYRGPVASITVDDLAQARRELEGRQVHFETPILDAKDGHGWTYFRGPDGAMYQLQGPYRCQNDRPEAV